MLKKLLMVFGFFTVSFFLSNTTASALDFRSGKNLNIPPTVEVDGSAFYSGTDVTVEGIIDGDLYCAGNYVKISGRVTGDVLCAAQSIEISGSVEGDARLAAKDIDIIGQIKGSASIASQRFTVQKTAMIGRDLTGASGDIAINGNISRDMLAGSTTLNISGYIGRDVIAGNKSFWLEDGAVIGRNVEYKGPQMIFDSSNGGIKGEVKYTKTTNTNSNKATIYGSVLGLAIMLFLMTSLVALGVIILTLAPHKYRRTTIEAKKNLWKPLLVGLLASIVAPAAIFTVGFTIIGIPFAFIILMIWLLIQLIGSSFFAHYLGAILFKKLNNQFALMLIGFGILMVVLLIPFIGFIALIFAQFMGIGMVMIDFFQNRPARNYSLSAGRLR